MTKMPIIIDDFIEKLNIHELDTLKKADLIELVKHFNMPKMTTEAVRDIIINKMAEHEIRLNTQSAAGGDVKTEAESSKVKELELQLQLKEMELRDKREQREHELQLKELEAKSGDNLRKSSSHDFDKYMKLVPQFEERQVIKYFLQFERLAKDLKWPKEAYSVLLQSALTGKAREIYAKLSARDKLNYDNAKSAILKAYGLWPEACQQNFRNSKKSPDQTYVIFAREKENLFTKWYDSMNVNQQFTKLKELMLLEEFNNCVDPKIKAQLHEQRVTTLEKAAKAADALTQTPKAYQHDTQKSFNINRCYRNPLMQGATAKFKWPTNSSNDYIYCTFCSRRGHTTTDCWHLTTGKKN